MPVGQVKNRIHQPNSNIHWPGLLDTTFFALHILCILLSITDSNQTNGARYQPIIELQLEIYAEDIIKTTAWLHCEIFKILCPPSLPVHLSITKELLSSWLLNFIMVYLSLGGGGGKLLPIHSLKWNPNNVLTTCKVISKGLASGFVYWSCALRQKL